MLGQGKNAWQAEIDAAAEVRFALPLHLYVGKQSFFSYRTSYALVSNTSKNFTLSNHPEILLVYGSKCLLVRHRHFKLDHHHTSRVEYRALEGFVLAVSPFNFTAIGGNLPGGQRLQQLVRITSTHLNYS